MRGTGIEPDGAYGQARQRGYINDFSTSRCSSGSTRASSESGDAWEGFLTGLGERGLRCPLLVISDGAAGLIGALERAMGAALRQRCLVHRARNVLAKVPKNAQAQVKADYWAIFDVPDKIEPGLDAVGYVQKRIDSFEKRWRDAYPAAVRCLLDDRDSLTVYLRFPREHWTRVRHSNFIERTFGETRRRVKVIGRLPGEHCCLKLVWAVLDRASAGWRGFTMTPAGLRLLADLRRSLHDPPARLPQRNSEVHTETGVASTDSVAIARITTVSERNLRPNFYTAPGTPPSRPGPSSIVMRQPRCVRSEQRRGRGTKTQTSATGVMRCRRR